MPPSRIAITQEEIEGIIGRVLIRIGPQSCNCSQSETLNKIGMDTTTTKTEVSILKDKVDKLEKDIDEIRHHLFGNGQPGTSAIILQLKNDMGVIKRIAWIALGFIVTGAAAAIINIIVTHPIPGITK